MVANVDVAIPPCRVGEVPRDEGYVCEPCDALTFSLWQVGWGNRVVATCR